MMGIDKNVTAHAKYDKRTQYRAKVKSIAPNTTSQLFHLILIHFCLNIYEMFSMSLKNQLNQNVYQAAVAN